MFQSLILTDCIASRPFLKVNWCMNTLDRQILSIQDLSCPYRGIALILDQIKSAINSQFYIHLNERKVMLIFINNKN